jgi:hypothetical protein
MWRLLVIERDLPIRILYKSTYYQLNVHFLPVKALEIAGDGHHGDGYQGIRLSTNTHRPRTNMNGRKQNSTDQKKHGRRSKSEKVMK